MAVSGLALVLAIATASGAAQAIMMALDATIATDQAALMHHLLPLATQTHRQQDKHN